MKNKYVEHGVQSDKWKEISDKGYIKTIVIKGNKPL